MLKIAWRNLWRNQTRTLVTATAIAVAYALYLMANGIQDWTFVEMRKAAARAAGGDVLVQQAGYLDRQENDQLLVDGAQLLARIRAVDGVEHAAGRVVISGLLSTSASSNPVVLRGIVAADEAPIQDMERYLVAGTFLPGDAADPLVLGDALAEELEVGLGDRVILTATDRRDEVTRSLFHVTGILNTGSPATDRVLAYTSLSAAQRALGAPQHLTQIGVLGALPRHSLADRVRAELANPDIDVLAWDVAMPDLTGFIEMKKGGGAFFGVLLFLVVLFSITNTFLMIVMERVREFGLLGALGVRPRVAAGILLTETALLALVSMFIGFVLALAAHAAIASHGIDVGALYGESLEVAGVSLTETRIYSRIEPLRWAQASLAVFVMVLLAAVYPAWKAARLRPTEAMRFYE